MIVTRIRHNNCNLLAASLDSTEHHTRSIRYVPPAYTTKIHVRRNCLAFRQHVFSGKQCKLRITEPQTDTKESKVKVINLEFKFSKSNFIININPSNHFTSCSLRFINRHGRSVRLCHSPCHCCAKMKRKKQRFFANRRTHQCP